MPRQALTPAQVLICDLDGTLIDSAPDLASAVGDLLAEVGRPPLALAAVRGMVGDGIATLVERALITSGGVPEGTEMPEYVARYAAFYEGRMTELTRPYPHVVEILNELKDTGWRLAICSNKPEQPCRHVLATLGMENLFEVIVGGDTFTARKPDPAPLHGILDQLGATLDEAVMLGDSRNDVLAARGAGLPVIAIASGYGPVPPQDLDADVLIDTFTELPDALATIAKGANPEPLA